MSGPVVGVVGAGQLGRMLLQAAIGPGFAVRFLAERGDDAAAQVTAHHEIGSAMSDKDLARFAAGCSVVTFEHEVVDFDGLEDLERGGAVLRPSPHALRLVSDKLAMRRALGWAGLPVPPWAAARSVEELVAAVTDWPEAVLKLSRGGYDGRGVFMVSGVEEAQAVGGRLLDRRVPLLVEPRLDFEMEAAVIAARRPGGDTIVYDPVRTIQLDGQCREVRVPSGLPPELADRARRLVVTAAERLDVVGLLAVELFLVDGELLVNELAARPHNTGHHSIDACVTSQFENHLRAVLDVELGSPRLRCAAATTVNVIGNREGDDPRRHLAAGLAADVEARVHLYGKQPRPDRKIGHVTICDDDAERASRRAWAVVEALRGDVPGRFADPAAPGGTARTGGPA